MRREALKDPRRSQTDARRSVRSALLVLEVKGKHYNKIFIGYAKNLSKDGLFLSARESLKAGDRFPVEFVLPDNKTKINCTGEVVWTRQRDSRGAVSGGIGLRFVDLDESKKRVIDDWVMRAEAKRNARNRQIAR